MGMLYAKESKLYSSEYIEIYIPLSYFENNIASNKGSQIETFGMVFIRNFDKDGNPNELKLLNVPTSIFLNIYSMKNDDAITFKNKPLDVLTLQYMKDSYVLHQTLPKGKEIAGAFLDAMLSAKLPKILKYDQILDVWWRNLQIADISYKVPSKIYEMIIASVYRNKNNPKQRYGQIYAKSEKSDGYDYETSSVREVVKNLSTFSGMVYEDISAMISNGLNNSVNGVEEPESPLEKIIHY